MRLGMGMGLYDLLRRAAAGMTPSTLLDGLSSYWPMNERTGTRYDVVGTNHLTPTNDPYSYNSGPRRTHAVFAAASYRGLSHADEDAFTPTGSFTASCWIYPRSSNVNFWMAKEYTDPTSEWSILTGAGGAIEGRFWGTGGLTQAGHPINWAAVNLNRWWLATMVYDDAAHTVTMYLDTTAGTPAATSGTLTNKSGLFTIGGIARATYTDGEMGQCGFWNRALSVDDITALYNSGKGLYYDELSDDLKVDLVSYWNLTEESGVRYDSHGAYHLSDQNLVDVKRVGPLQTVASTSYVASTGKWLSRDNFRMPDSFTISMWVYGFSGYPNLPTGDPNMTYMFYAGQYYPYQTAANITGGGYLGGMLYGNNVGAGEYKSAGGFYGNWIDYSYWSNSWHFFTFSYDATTRTGQYRIDDRATPIIGETLTEPAWRNDGDWLYLVGQPNVSTENRFASYGIWNKVLSQAEHQSIYNGGIGKKYSDLTAADKVGLVAYWNLDEHEANPYDLDPVRVDSHGSNHLTSHNVPYALNTQHTPSGGALSVNWEAANGQLLSASDELYDLSGGFTVAGWYYTTEYDFNTYPQRRFFSMGKPYWAGGTGNIYASNGNSGPQILFFGAHNSSEYPQGYCMLPMDAWNLIVLWYDPATKKAYMRVNNGAPEESTTALTGAHPITNGIYLEVGGEGYGYALAGTARNRYSDYAIWHRVLTDDERDELYNLGKGKFYDFAG